jgi:hypothetical protein
MTDTRITARQHLTWVLISELEMAPTQWGRPVRDGDVRNIARDFNPDMFGAVCVWYRKELPVGRGRYVIVDGQHRTAGARLALGGDQRVPCLVYEGLTMETAAELSLGLQERRNLHAVDRHRAALAAHDRRAVEIDKLFRFLALTLTYNTKPTDRGRLSAIAALNQVWDRMGAGGVERVLTISGQAWDRTASGYGAAVFKLIMMILAAHDGAVNDVHLGEILAARSPAQWTARETAPRRSLSSLAQDVIIEYNKRPRGGNRLPEMTPSQYETAAKRTQAPRVTGKLEGVERKTATPAGRGPRRGRSR